MNSSCGIALDFSSCKHLHGSWHMAVIFEPIVPIGACTKQMWPKCRIWRRMSFNECILLCSSHALWNQFAVHIRKKFSTQIHRTHLWPFPVSSVLNRFLKLIAEKKLSVLASWQIRLLKDVQTHNVFPCHRALFTFVYILPPWFHPS